MCVYIYICIYMCVYTLFSDTKGHTLTLFYPDRLCVRRSLCSWVQAYASSLRARVNFHQGALHHSRVCCRAAITSWRESKEWRERWELHHSRVCCRAAITFWRKLRGWREGRKGRERGYSREWESADVSRNNSDSRSKRRGLAAMRANAWRERGYSRADVSQNSSFTRSKRRGLAAMRAHASAGRVADSAAEAVVRREARRALFLLAEGAARGERYTHAYIYIYIYYIYIYIRSRR